jgi:hypothetical protein
VPRISEFYGIVIWMYWNEHPPPHVHAQYAEFEASFVIATGESIDREFPVRASRLVREWLDQHREELEANWDRARRGETPIPIDPLP